MLEPLSPRGEEERLRTTGPRDEERLSAMREGRGVGWGEGPILLRVQLIADRFHHSHFVVPSPTIPLPEGEGRRA